MRSKRQHQRQDREAGVTLIFMAISVTGLMAVSGLIIDGGRAYAERRQMQNAADAGAMAGTRQLDKAREAFLADPPQAFDESTIYDAALAAALDNGADAGDEFQCIIVDVNGDPNTGSADSSACPQTDVSELPGGTEEAAGVAVVVHNTVETFLIRVVGAESFRARADATAQVQGLREVSAAATPFMICGNGRPASSTDSPGAPDLVIADGDQWKINPDAVWDAAGTPPGGEPSLSGGPWYIVHGPNNTDVPGCGSTSQGWKGWVDGSGDFSIPGWWGSQPGNRSGPAKTILRDPDSCANGELDDCILVVPVCVDGQGNGQNVELYCVKFGAFKVADTASGNSGNRHHIALLGDAIEILGEGGGGGPPQVDELRVIKLTK